MQNRLEVWWCKLDDAANAALNIHLRIIQRLAHEFRRRTELMFGRELISPQSIGVSICWGLISAKLTVVTLGLTASNSPFMIVGMLLQCFIFWIFSKWPRRMPKKMHWYWLLSVIILWLTMIFSAYTSGTLGNRLYPVPPSPTVNGVNIVRLGIAVIPLYVLGVLFSIPVCIIFIAVLRRSLDLISHSKSNKSVVTAAVLYSIFSLTIVALHLFAFKALKNKTDFRQYIFQVITPVMGYAYSMTIFLILMLAHMIFWGVMQRPIYTLARIGVERRKKLFAALGFLLIGLAFPSVMEAAKTLALHSFKFIFG